MIYLDSPPPSDAARAFFADFDRRVLNQKIFDAVKQARAADVPQSPAEKRSETEGRGHV